MRVEIACPAKINTFLSVGKPDFRGYHPIRTIFQAVSLFDRLVIELASEADKFTSNWEQLPADNTVTKAWNLLREFVTMPRLSVHLDKFIPTEAGFGGGSSDAAAFLRAVRPFLKAQPEAHEWLEIAKAVGADVPFFLVGGRALGEGYGHVLTPLEDPQTEWYVLAKPAVGMPTGSAYRALDALDYEFRALPAADGDLYNDFERVADCASLDLIERLESLGCVSAGLSGSGSAVFGICRTEAHANQIADGLRSENVNWTHVAKSLTRAESL